MEKVQKVKNERKKKNVFAAKKINLLLMKYADKWKRKMSGMRCRERKKEKV